MFWRGGEVVTLWSAKPTGAGSIPAHASLPSLKLRRVIRPGWQNWYARETKNFVTARSCGFDAHPGHISTRPATAEQAQCKQNLI